MKTALYVCAVASLWAATHANAQFGGSSSNIIDFRGHLVDGGPASFSGLVVDITSLRDRTIRDHADVMADGSFSFRSLPEGDYELRVTNLYGHEIVSTVTTVSQHAMSIEVRMPDAKLSQPGTGTVSLQQLTHPPTKQVRKLLETGKRLAGNERYNDAAVQLREATRSAPDCMQAHADLAMVLVKLQDWEGAATEYRAAIALEPRNSILHSNLGAALASTQHLDEAEQEASVALKLDPNNPRGHLVMATVLLQRRDSIARALPHLAAVQDQFPTAKSALGKLCSLPNQPGLDLGAFCHK